MNNKIEIWASEYELRQFIDTATRWDVDAIYNTKTEHRPFSLLTDYVLNARSNYDAFAYQLREKLTKNENWKAIGLDLNRRFLVGINQYINWYHQNKGRFQKFESNCPYTFMLGIVESTRDEILNYFPEYGQENKASTNSNTKKKLRISAKHYVLTYILECHTNGMPLPIGQKNYLEQVGNKRIGAGKGNRFYKVFNEISLKDLNSEKALIEIGGENWKSIVFSLSQFPEQIKNYLNSKGL